MVIRIPEELVNHIHRITQVDKILIRKILEAERHYYLQSLETMDNSRENNTV